MKIRERSSSNRSIRWTEQDRGGTVTKNIRDAEHLAAGDPHTAIHAGVVIRAQWRADNSLR
jgi:hypothetical protein